MKPGDKIECPCCGRFHELHLFDGKDANGYPGKKLLYYNCDGTAYGWAIGDGVEYGESTMTQAKAVECFRKMLYGAPFE